MVEVEPDPADQQPRRGQPPVRAVLGHRDLGAVMSIASVHPLVETVSSSRHSGAVRRADGELDIGELVSRDGCDELVLHAEKAEDVGIVITRAAALSQQDGR